MWHNQEQNPNTLSAPTATLDVPKFRHRSDSGLSDSIISHSSHSNETDVSLSGSRDNLSFTPPVTDPDILSTARMLSQPLTKIPQQLKKLISDLKVDLKTHVPLEGHNLENPNIFYQQYTDCVEKLLKGDFDKSLFEECSKQLIDLAGLRFDMANKNKPVRIQTPAAEYYALLSKFLDIIVYVNKYILSIEATAAKEIEQFQQSQNDYNQRIAEVNQGFENRIAAKQALKQTYAQQLATTQIKISSMGNISQQTKDTTKTIEDVLQINQNQLRYCSSDLAVKIGDKILLERDLENLSKAVAGVYPKEIMLVRQEIEVIERARAQEMKKWFPSGDKMVVYNRNLVEFKNNYKKLVYEYEMLVQDLLTKYGSLINSQLERNYGRDQIEQGFTSKFARFLEQHLRLVIQSLKSEIEILNRQHQSLLAAKESWQFYLMQSKNALAAQEDQTRQFGAEYQLAVAKQYASQRQRIMLQKKQSDTLQKLHKRELQLLSANICEQACSNAAVCEARRLCYNTLQLAKDAIEKYRNKALESAIDTNFLCAVKAEIMEYLQYFLGLSQRYGSR